MNTDTTAARLAHQISDRALAWLDSVRGQFALPDNVPEEQIPGKTLKSLSELALMASLVCREAVAGPDSARTARRLLDFAWQQLDEGGVPYRLQAASPAATYPIEMYAPFAAAGYRHPGLDRLTAHLLGLRAGRVIEHVPNRRLAVVAAANAIGVTIPDDVNALIGQTWLGGTPEPWMLDATNAYGVTHTVFHLTDYGASPDSLPAHLHDYLHRWLPVWVEVHCETHLWDLLLELLIVGTCLSPPLFFPAIWEHVATAQRPDGVMPNGVTTPPADTQAAWLNHYHPTIVAVVAGTLTLSRTLAATTPGPA